MRYLCSATCWLLIILVRLPAVEPLALPHATVDLPTDPAVVWERLDNGLIVAVRPNDEPADKLSLRLYIRAGSIDETDDERGAAHYLEHMAFNGSEHFAPGELIETLQKLGVGFGNHLNAHTGFEETVYKLDLPDAETATLEQGLLVMADWAGGLSILPEEVERERGVILAEMRDRDSPGLRRARHTYGAFFAETRVADRFPIGVAETVSAMTAADLRGYYERWYRPDNMVLAVVGAVDPTAVLPLVRQRFGSLPPAKEPRPTKPIGDVATSPFQATVYVDEELGDSLLRWVGLQPAAPADDGPAWRRRMLYRDLVADIVERRFADIAEAADAPIVGGGFGIWHSFGHRNALIQVRVKEARFAAALRLLEHERRRLLEFGVTAAELSVAVAGKRADLARAVERAATRTNADLARALYVGVREGQVFLTPEQQQALYEPWLAAATPAVLQEAIADPAWNDPHRAVLSLEARTTPAAAGEDGQAWLAEHWHSAADEQVAPPAEAELATWAYGDRPQHEAQVQGMVLDHGILQATLDNGVQLYALPRDAKPGEVLLQLTLFKEPGLPPRGLPELAMAFQAAGLGAHDASQLRQIMAGHSIRISGPQIGYDRITFSASCLPGEVGLASEWLRALIEDPGWRPEPFERLRQQLRERLAAAPYDLDWRLGDHWSLLTGSTMGEQRPLRANELDGVRLVDLRQWLEPQLQGAGMEVALVGDVGGDILMTLAETFATLPSRQMIDAIEDLTAPGALPSTPPLPQGDHRFTFDGTVARSIVRVAWPTDDEADIMFRRRMGLVGQALREGLRERVREELGQAYSPSAGHRGSLTIAGAGYLLAHMAVEPGQEAAVLAALDQAVADLQEHGVSDDLFDRLITPIRSSLVAYRDTNAYWLNSVVAGTSRRPQQLDWASSMSQAYEEMTAAELTDLVRRYLIEDHRLLCIGTSTGAKNVDAEVDSESEAEAERTKEAEGTKVTK